MPKRELASDQGATYCYAKIVREPTLANKRKRVMSLMHILKFIKKHFGTIFEVVLHPNLISWVLVHEWEGCL
jgi:hypothetical protein